MPELCDFLKKLSILAPKSMKLEVNPTKPENIHKNINFFKKSIGNTYIRDKDIVNEIFLVTIGNSTGRYRRNLNLFIPFSSLAPILFFDCGIHAREWISPATCLFLIQD